MEVNRDVIKWALDWNRLSVEELASKAEFKGLPKWLSGEKEPTFKQLEKFAARTHTLVPYFYMDSLPQVALQIPDFRTTSASPLAVRAQGFSRRLTTCYFDKVG